MTEANSSSDLNKAPIKEAGKNLHCLFISGAMDTNQGISGVKGGLEEAYGLGNVAAFNSILSTDTPSPKRFDQMAEFIEQHAKDGLDVIVHSLGSVELIEAIKKVKKKDKAFFDKEENRKNLHIILSSPSGFNKGFLGPAKYLERTVRFNRQEGEWGILSKSKAERRGIDALTAFPLEGIGTQELATSLRKALPRLSQYREEVARIPLAGGKGYTPNLSAEDQEIVKEYSGWFQAAIRDGKYDIIRRLTAEYGGRFRKQLNKVFAGEFDDKREVQSIKNSFFGSVGGRIRMLNVMINALGSMPMDELAKLDIPMTILVPEYDVFVKVNEAMAFLEGSSEKSPRHVKIAEGITHKFPGLQGKEFAKVVRNI